MSDNKKKKTVKATPTKAKKNKKKMSPEAKDKLKTSFYTLINNDACIKTSREFKGIGWEILAVGLALSSCVVAVVPNFVNRVNVDYGNSVLSAPNYNYDEGLTQFTKELAANGIEFSIDNDGHPSLGTTEATWNEKMAYDSTNKCYYYKEKSSSQDKTMFQVFITPKIFTTAGAFANIDDTTFFARIKECKNPTTGETRADLDSSESESYTNKTSYIAFGYDKIEIGRYTSAGKGSTLQGENAALKGTKFNEFNKKDDGTVATDSEIKTTVTNKYKAAIRSMTQNEKMTGAWQYTGIIFGVYVGLCLLFGLILFLLTRGKRNPFRIYTFWETQKMAYWASFTPAVLAMCLGFMLSQFAMLAFIFLYGMRIMWMAMKSLRPAA